MQNFFDLWHFASVVFGIGLSSQPKVNAGLIAGVLSVIAILIIAYFVWSYFHGKSSPKETSQVTNILKKGQQQTDILIRSIADGVIVVDTRGVIGIINPSAETMTGWTAEEATGIDVRQVMKLSPENAKTTLTNDPFSAVLTQHQQFNQTLVLTSRNNKQVIISLVVSPIIMPKTEEIAGAVAIFRDVSAAKREEQQRAEFISTASHEMRTPVAAIEGYLALALNDRVSKIDSHARDYLEKAHASTKHLGKLFQDLLTSAKAEDGRLSNHPKVTEISAFLERLSEDLRISATKKSLSVEFVVGTNPTGLGNQVIDARSSTGSLNKVVSPLYYVWVDPERMREVITNLFDNAVKYTDSGKISIGLTGDKSVVQISVKDTGAGIPAEDIPHLFQKFYRVDNSATRTVGGAGLGLFICRKIIELYSGRIWAESELGKGSTFYINLPRIDSQKAIQMQAEENKQSPAMSTITST